MWVYPISLTYGTRSSASSRYVRYGPPSPSFRFQEPRWTS